MQSLLQIHLMEERGCAPGSHSWAWIEPSGVFHKVEDHGVWALTRFREEIVKYPEIANKFSKLTSPSGYQDVDSEGPAVSISTESLQKLQRYLLQRDLEEDLYIPPVWASEKERSAWEHIVNVYYRHGADLAKTYTLSLGWMKAGNPFTVHVLDKGTPAQWKSFFENGIRCWSGSFERKMYADVEDHYHTMDYIEGIYEYLPKKEAEALVGRILQKS